MEQLKKITLTSGKELQIGLSSFAVATQLFRCVAKELKNVDVKLDFELDFVKAIKDENKTNEQLNFIKNVFANLISSMELEEVLFECFKKCIYDKTKKVDRELFEGDIDARSDFLEIAWEVAKYNLYPFLKNLLSKLKK